MARYKVRVDGIRTERLRIVALESNLKRGPLRQVIDAKGVKVRDEARRRAPVYQPVPIHPRAKPRKRAPGTLRRSIYARVRTVDGWPASEVGSKDPVAGFVIAGTVPHEIRPNRAKALSFWWTKAGHFVLTQRVFHPGTRANDFLSASLPAARL